MKAAALRASASIASASASHLKLSQQQQRQNAEAAATVAGRLRTPCQQRQHLQRLAAARAAAGDIRTRFQPASRTRISNLQENDQGFPMASDLRLLQAPAAARHVHASPGVAFPSSAPVPSPGSDIDLPRSRLPNAQATSVAWATHPPPTFPFHHGWGSHGHMRQQQQQQQQALRDTLLVEMPAEVSPTFGLATLSRSATTTAALSTGRLGPTPSSAGAGGDQTSKAQRSSSTPPAAPRPCPAQVENWVYHVGLAWAAMEKTAQGIAAIAGLGAEDIVKIKAQSAVFRPAYYIAVDHSKRLVIVSFRGTSTSQDMLTSVSAGAVGIRLPRDLCAVGPTDGAQSPAAAPAAAADPADPAGSGESNSARGDPAAGAADCCRGAESDPETFYGHMGAARAAEWFLQKELEDLAKVLDQHKGYSLRLVGHSLGGAVASILAVRLRRQRFRRLRGLPRDRISCVGVSTPPCMSHDMAACAADYISTLVLQDDVVPRLSILSLQGLASDMLLPWWRRLTGTKENGESQRVKADLCTPGRVFHLVRNSESQEPQPQARPMERQQAVPPMARLPFPPGFPDTKPVFAAVAAQCPDSDWSMRQSSAALQTQLYPVQAAVPISLPLHTSMPRSFTIAFTGTVTSWTPGLHYAPLTYDTWLPVSDLLLPPAKRMLHSPTYGATYDPLRLSRTTFRCYAHQDTGLLDPELSDEEEAASFGSTLLHAAKSDCSDSSVTSLTLVDDAEATLILRHQVAAGVGQNPLAVALSSTLQGIARIPSLGSLVLGFCMLFAVAVHSTVAAPVRIAERVQYSLVEVPPSMALQRIVLSPNMLRDHRAGNILNALNSLRGSP